MSGWEIALDYGAPVLAFVGALVGAWLGRRASKELDKWRKREETMRLLRWGVDHAAGTDRRAALIGIELLFSLLGSPLLQDEDRQMVREVAKAIATQPPP